MHQTAAETWRHHWQTDQTLIVVGLLCWIAWLTAAAYWAKNRCHKMYAWGLWGLVNIVGAFVIGQDNLLSALIFLNGGFVLLVYAVFSDKINWKGVRNGRRKPKG